MLQKLILLSLLLINSMATTGKASPVDTPNSLDIIESYFFNIPEISGMCWRQDPENKQRQLVIVGDKTHSLYIVNWDERQQGIYQEFPLSHLTPGVSKAR
jgi:hypothetical protein